MNAINSLLGPLEAATRLQSWEDAEDIAREIARLCRLQRLCELQKIQEAIADRQKAKTSPRPSCEEIELSGYPLGWPVCPSCGKPALDGHITCGLVSCRESLWR